MFRLKLGFVVRQNFFALSTRPHGDERARAPPLEKSLQVHPRRTSEVGRLNGYSNDPNWPTARSLLEYT